MKYIKVNKRKSDGIVTCNTGVPDFRIKKRALPEYVLRPPSFRWCNRPTTTKTYFGQVGSSRRVEAFVLFRTCVILFPGLFLHTTNRSPPMLQGSQWMSINVDSLSPKHRGGFVFYIWTKHTTLQAYIPNAILTSTIEFESTRALSKTRLRKPGIPSTEPIAASTARFHCRQSFPHSVITALAFDLHLFYAIWMYVRCKRAARPSIHAPRSHVRTIKGAAALSREPRGSGAGN